jgi:hypothetical protein
MYHYQDSKLRQEEILREAERYRLISQFKRRPSGRNISLAATLAWWGSKLINWGHFLQERFGDQGLAEESRVTN